MVRFGKKRSTKMTTLILIFAVTTLLFADVVSFADEMWSYVTDQSTEGNEDALEEAEYPSYEDEADERGYQADSVKLPSKVKKIKKSKGKISSLKAHKGYISCKSKKVKGGAYSVIYQLQYKRKGGYWTTFNCPYGNIRLTTYSKKITYYFRVRPVVIYRGAAYYGKWSGKKKVKSK